MPLEQVFDPEPQVIRSQGVKYRVLHLQYQEYISSMLDVALHCSDVKILITKIKSYRNIGSVRKGKV
ncbi:MAG: hypothetical protein C5B59_07885 [Bacteroidetes bacterium]|nr:MAG: hypothetical protein C5B59_07885 [Bacteroidota bacterium]